MPKNLTPPPTRFIYNPAGRKGFFNGLPGINTSSLVRHHAPDAVVLINRQFSLPLCNECSCTRSIKEDITNLSISVGINNSPSSASFTIAAPITAPTNYYDRGYFRLTPMQEVNIYLKGRFPVSLDSEDIGKVGSIDSINSPFPYYHCFWGIISSVKKSETPTGNELINVECSDILRFWEMTEVLLNPSAQNVIRPIADDLTIYNTVFTGKSLDTIIVELAENIHPRMFIEAGLGAAADEKRNKNIVELNKPLMEYWRERFNSISSKIRIFGYSGIIRTAESDKSKEEINDYFRQSERKFFKITNSEDKDFRLINNVKPLFDTQISSPSVFQSTTDNMLSIAKTNAENSYWEFYQDVTGEIILKPPFFNLDVKDYAPHVIEPQEIINEEHVTEEGSVLTSIEVTGSIGFGVQNDELVYGRFTDFSKSLMYGYRNKRLRAAYLVTAKDVNLLAMDALAMHNAKVLYTATMEIVGRPEIRPGFPIYLPHKDMYYYVESVSHNFTWGETFTTSLVLIAGRRRLYSLPISGSEEYETGINVNKEPLKNYYMVRTDEPIIVEEKKSSQNLRDALPQQYKRYGKFLSDRGVWEFKSGEKLKQAKPNYSPVPENDSDILSNDFRDVIPVSDEEGYELIGTLPYGRYLKITETGDLDYNSDYISRGINPQNVENKLSLRGKAVARKFLKEVNPDFGKSKTVPKNQNKAVAGPYDKKDVASLDRDQMLELIGLVPDEQSGVCDCSCHFPSTKEQDDVLDTLKSEKNGKAFKNASENAS